MWSMVYKSLLLMTCTTQAIISSQELVTQVIASLLIPYVTCLFWFTFPGLDSVGA